MALVSTTISTNTLPTIVAGDNPIIIDLSTNSIGSAGYARGKIDVHSLYTSGVTLTFDLSGTTTNYQKVFTGKRFPNNDQYYLTDTLEDQEGNVIDNAITIYQITSSLADCLKKDVTINRDYFINYSGGTKIELIARQAGTVFRLDGGRITSSNGGAITFVSVSTGSDQFSGSQIPEYNLFVEVYKGSDTLQLGETTAISDYQRVTELSLPFSSDNIHRFDVSTICKSFVTTALPNLNATTVTKVEGYILPFSFAYGEQYPLVAGTNTTKKLQKGIISRRYVANASLPILSANTLTTYTGTSIPFLTNQPAIKKSNRDAKELLYFLAGKNIGGSKSVRVNMTFWDGSTQNATLYPGITGSTNYGGLHYLNVSHDLCLAVYETGSKKVKTAQFRVSGLTQTQTYSFPPTDPRARYGVVFQNALGTFDTVDFYGNEENTIDRQNKTITYPLSINQNGSVTHGFKHSAVYDVQVTGRINVNSGWINETHFDWLKELMKSNEIYHYNDNGSLEYLTLDGFKYSKSNQTNQYFVECSFIKTISENSVSV